MHWDGIWHAAKCCGFDEFMLYVIWWIFKWENPTLVILLKEKSNVGWHSHIYRPISFKLAVTETTKLYSLIPVWIILTCIQGHKYMRKREPLCYFLTNILIDFRWILVCCRDVLVYLGSCSCLFAGLRLIFKAENSTSMMLKKSICWRVAGMWMLMNQSLLNLAWR